MGLFKRRTFVTAKDIAEQFKLSQAMVYKLAKDPQYQKAYCKINGAIRIDQNEFERIVEQNSMN